VTLLFPWLTVGFLLPAISYPGYTGKQTKKIQKIGTKTKKKVKKSVQKTKKKKNQCKIQKKQK
jgi:hypothetical protein